MSEAAAPQAPAFSPRVILALVLVGVISFSALAVLSAYAPEIRAGSEGGGNALSGSAVGFKGAVILLQARGVPAVVSRTRPPAEAAARSLLVLTPSFLDDPKELQAFPPAAATLVVLDKWRWADDPKRKGFVVKVGPEPFTERADRLLKPFAASSTVAKRKGVSKPVLHGTGTVFAEGTYLPLAQIEGLQTISGEGWIPLLADEQGRPVLVRSKKTPHLHVLADPDLLNTQGVAKLDNARAGMAVIDALRGDGGVLFDVTLNGYKRGQGLWRMMLEPPWLAATLCAVAAAVLMGLHALARFGPARARGRAFALGKRALVDNSAGLVRMARKEHELAPAYVGLTKTLVGRVAGGTMASADDAWLARLARTRGADDSETLEREAERARSRADLVALARKLYAWRLEMTRERR
ncbi:DUF4350 domain-containing protein [Phenylobacterium sp.]|jgi:hypothetical protein|uniref:DUF4350 domain-containing protein n=1 Tax=Phenylobacterium sp. TaxID=1871053 RepID=UPI002F947E3C